MRTELILRISSLLLLVGLAGQVSLRVPWNTKGIPTEPIRIGEPFPAAILSVDEREETSFPDGCWVGFVIHPECLSCGQLADRLGGRTGRGETINLFWISFGGHDQTTEFVEAHGLPPEWMFVLRDGREGRDFTLLHGMGLGAVPTRLLFFNGGMVSEILMTHELPDAPNDERFCWPAS